MLNVNPLLDFYILYLFPSFFTILLVFLMNILNFSEIQCINVFILQLVLFVTSLRNLCLTI